MKRVKPVRPASTPCADATAILDQLVTLKIEEDRLRALLERIKTVRAEAMVMLARRVQEAARAARAAKRMPRGRR
jgi:hypothetical protein